VSPIRRTIKKLLGEEPHSRATGVRPFFVCGHPRSGTHWVSALLNLHPRIYCDGEFHFHLLRNGMDAFESQAWYVASREPVRAEAEAAFRDLVLRCLAAQARRPDSADGAVGGPLGGGKRGAIHVGDHTPRMLRVIIPPPEGRYIVIFRDGRDVLVSWTFHLLKTSRPDIMHADVRPIFERSLAGLGDSADSARAAAAALLGDRAWIEHFAAAWSDHTAHDLATLARLEGEGRGDSLLRIDYETLHADTERERARLYSFLGADPSEAAPLSRENNTAAGFGRDAPRAFFRKGEVGDWRNYLTDESHGWFLDRAGSSLRDLKYDMSPARCVPSAVNSATVIASHITTLKERV